MALSTLLLSWFPLLLLIVALLPFLLSIYKNEKIKPSTLPPGPAQLPVVGNLHQLGELPHRSLWSLSRKYGPIMYLQLGRIPTIIISSAKMAMEVMQTHDIDVCSRPIQTPQKKLSYNSLDVAFGPYGQYWREMRKFCVLELLSSKRVQTSRFIREEEVADVVRSINKSLSSSLPVNLSALSLNFTTNTTCRAAFGKSYHNEDEVEKQRFHRVLDEARSVLGEFFIGDFLPWMWGVDLISGLHQRLEKNFRDLDEFYERIIEDHLDPNRPKPQQEDFVDLLLQVQKDFNLTRDHIKGILMDILVAGTDTSSAAMVWAMAELIRNPRAMKIVQEEVRSVIGKKEMVEEGDLHQLQYLKAVAKETMRLHSPSPLLIPRETMQKCEIGGYEILPKTRIFVNAFAIGRDPEYWENPLEFLPERFIENPIDFKGQNFEFVPFGGGRRICPGIRFGTLAVELPLANLLYLFDWKLPVGMKKEDLDMKESFGIVVHKKVPLELVPLKPHAE